MNRLTTLNVCAVAKADERYVILYDDAHLWDAYEALWRWAANDELSLSWYDYDVMRRKLKGSEYETH